MPAQTTSLSSQLEDSSESSDREIFSRQTLVLTALTAINNPNNHPTFNNIQVNQERLKFMKEKASQTSTPIIDAATTILVTDTEILATMAHGANASHGIVAIKEIEIEKGDELVKMTNEKIVDSLNQSELGNDVESTLMILRGMDGHLPDEFYPLPVAENDEPELEDVFVSFPNINEALGVPLEKSTSNPICRPIEIDIGHWAEIMKRETGFIFGSPK